MYIKRIQIVEQLVLVVMHRFQLLKHLFIVMLEIKMEFMFRQIVVMVLQSRLLVEWVLIHLHHTLMLL